MHKVEHPGNPRVGAFVVGGQHPGLGIARSLGRRGIPVVFVDDRQSIARFSRYTTRFVRVRDLLDERNTIDAVMEVGHRLGLRGWVLFPTRDETVAAFARHREELADFFTVTTAPWEAVQWAWDKKKTYELAANLGIPCPRTFNPDGEADVARLASRLPLAIKPAVKENFFYATGAKAWRADTPEQLQKLYASALSCIRPEEILVQEIIPGDGGCQFSYCAYVHDGRPHSVLIARRERQHPREFGRAATYVETTELPAIEALSERFLNAIGYRGLVEIEFKQDPRDGAYKLLDVNARTWGFQALGAAAGVDFAYLAFAAEAGQMPPRSRAKSKVGWLRMITDVPTAFSELATGRLGMPGYLRSLARTRTESAFAADDVLPSLAELALLPVWALEGLTSRRGTQAGRLPYDTRQITFAPSSDTSSDPS